MTEEAGVELENRDDIPAGVIEAIRNDIREAKKHLRLSCEHVTAAKMHLEQLPD